MKLRLLDTGGFGRGSEAQLQREELRALNVLIQWHNDNLETVPAATLATFCLALQEAAIKMGFHNLTLVPFTKSKKLQ